MPTINYRRAWCQSCQDWKLFNSDIKCKTCDSEHQSTLLSDIPEDKLLEQQNRYKEQKSRKFHSIMNVFSSTYGLDNFTTPVGQTNIKEADAGVESIRAAKKKEREEAIEYMKSEREKYKNLGRNENCRCSSGKKFKKCCERRINTYR